MYSEITVSCEQDLPIGKELTEALEKRLGPSHNKLGAVYSTKHFNRLFRSQVIYAHSSPDKVYLIQHPEISTLKIHIESNIKKEDLRELKKSIEETISYLEDFLKAQKITHKEIKAIINAEDYHIATARVISTVTILKKTFNDNLLTEIPFPIITFILNLSFKRDVLTSALGAGAATLAAISLIVLKVLFSKKLVYSEE